MERRRLASRGGIWPVELDLCMSCQAIWFDNMESAQLTPGAVLELFDLIREGQGQPPRPISGSCACPVCHHALALVHDFERTNRITYYRCAGCHGRLTTFTQFLVEKNFVRSLSPAEISRLRAVVAQIRCASCGAPIDLAHDAACSYCRAPIAILDADAVQGTVAQLTHEEQARRPPMTPRVAVESLLTVPQESSSPAPEIIAGVLELLFNIV
jgi:hypothetical protein